MAKEIVATVPPLAIDYLPLEGELQAFFHSSAKQKIQLVNQQGQTILCRINARVTLLKGTGLAGFLAAMSHRHLAFVPLRDGVVLVCPAEDRRPPSKSTTAVTREHPNRTSSSNIANGGQSDLVKTDSRHPVNSSKTAPREHTDTKIDASNSRSTPPTSNKNRSPGSPSSETGTIIPIEPPTPKRKKAGTPPGARAAITAPAQLTLFPDTEPAHATSQRRKPDATAEYRFPSSRPGSPAKAVLPLARARTAPASAPAVASAPAPGTSPVAHPKGASRKKYELTPLPGATPVAHPQEVASPSLPAGIPGFLAINPVEETDAQKKQKEAPATAPTAGAKEPPTAEVPLVIHFAPEEDQPIIAAVAQGQVTPATDLFLHRQALLLSLSSGFDDLLSLAAVHDVQPLDYQLATVRHVLKNMRGRALLCDEVGMGKTIEAGLILMEYLLRGLVRRVLILTPPSLVEQWQQEMQVKFNLDFVSYDAPAFKAAANPWLEFPHIIASVDTAKRPPHREQVLASEFDLVIVDEAHHLKNKHTQAYQLVSQIKKKYILLLTATPVENNMEELFNLITLLLPGQLETAASFKRKYITRGDPLKPKNTESLKRLLREVMVRNRRSETGVIRSRRRADTVELTLSPEEMAFYNRLTSFVRGYYTPQAQQTTSGVNQFILRTLQREVGSSIDAVLPTLEKMAANPVHPEPLRRVLQTLAAQGRAVKVRAKTEVLVKLLHSINDKVIVFTSFQETQALLARWLRQEGFPVAELHGQMRRQEKEDQVRLFAGEARVLVSTENGSEGRNLQFCHFLVNYDLPWNPMRIEQRIGRIHRLGQEHDVQIYNLAAAGTVEAYILELLDAKINMFQLVVGELDMILGTLHEKKDFEDLVMEVWAGAADEGDVRAGMDSLGDQLLAAKSHYQAVKALDERLLGELLPDE